MRLQKEEQIGKSFKKNKVPVKVGLSSKTRFEFMKEVYEKTLTNL